ncbi:MAG: NAD(P)H-dependent oxidoreductase [Candidatus Paracaedibacteraceae bacterium]|nr:NAD(P)H-dependent oxidoreductase [Candidatus Paracaedibacteraceae bacterium]
MSRANKTFKYASSSSGPQGLLKDPPIILVITSGGYYKGTSYDRLAPYMHSILKFIGITDIATINAQGLAMDEQRKASLTSSNGRIVKSNRKI